MVSHPSEKSRRKKGQPLKDEPGPGRYDEILAKARYPKKDGVIDWKTLCDGLNEAVAIYRENLPGRTLIRSDNNLEAELRVFGFEFLSESLLELPSFIRESLTNLANCGCLSVLTNRLISAGMFDARVTSTRV